MVNPKTSEWGLGSPEQKNPGLLVIPKTKVGLMVSPKTSKGSRSLGKKPDGLLVIRKTNHYGVWLVVNLKPLAAFKLAHGGGRGVVYMATTALQLVEVVASKA